MKYLEINLIKVVYDPSLWSNIALLKNIKMVSKYIWIIHRLKDLIMLKGQFFPDCFIQSVE